MPRLVQMLTMAAVLAVFLVSAAPAQTVISAHSGLIHYMEGQVTLDGKAIETRNNRFPEMKEKELLKTQDGRAEILLSPGAFYSGSALRASSMTPSEGLASFLRVGEDSEVRLASNRLTDTRIEFLSGDVLVECAEIQKGSKVTLLYKDQAIEMRKNGLYRLTGQPVLLRVYRGEATIAEGAKVTALREGRQMTLNGLDIVEKFDNKLGDPLYRWSKRRSEYIALANVSAAKSLRDSGYSLTSSAWRWNPWFGMYTFIPCRGMYWSPFGYGYYAPNTIYRVYERPNPSIVAGHGGGGGGFGGGGATYNPNLGYSTVSRSDNASYSGSSVSSSAPAAAASSASSGARGGDSGGGRDTGSGGGRGK